MKEKFLVLAVCFVLVLASDKVRAEETKSDSERKEQEIEAIDETTNNQNDAKVSDSLGWTLLERRLVLCYRYCKRILFGLKIIYKRKHCLSFGKHENQCKTCRRRGCRQDYFYTFRIYKS